MAAVREAVRAFDRGITGLMIVKLRKYVVTAFVQANLRKAEGFNAVSKSYQGNADGVIRNLSLNRIQSYRKTLIFS